MLMILFVERDILKSSQLYSSSNNGDKPDMNISLTFNSLTEWVGALLPLTSNLEVCNSV